MSDTSQPNSKSVRAGSALLAELGSVDKSLRFPVLFFTFCAIIWLVVANTVTLITSIQSYKPDFLAALPWFTYGRLYPLAANAMLFGWGCNAIFAVALWLIARLSLSPVRDGGILIIAGIFWNAGLKLGLFGILIGKFTPLQSLELPGYATPILLIAYALIGVWGVQAFLVRQKKTVNVSQWYILAALFLFPWIYMIAQFMAVWFPVRGVLQSVVSHWFDASFLNLWLAPIALAVAYYLIPKILGRPIHSYSMALFGFCALILAGSWTGLVSMVGGPIPVWLSSTSIVASVVMMMPIGVVVLNLFLSAKGFFAELWRSIALRFVLIGVASYLLVGLLGSVVAFHSVNEIVQFTTVISAYKQLFVYAFFSMTLFGGLYFMVPRLSGREWPSIDLIHLHFWGSLIGITIIVSALFWGGLSAGMQMNNPEISFSKISDSLIIWLKMSTIGIVCLLVGHMAFTVNFFWMLIAGHRVAEVQSPTVLESFNQEGAT